MSEPVVGIEGVNGSNAHSAVAAGMGGTVGDPFSNYPSRDIPHPHPHDVLCGRGGGTNAHIGNSHWRMLVAANKELYVTLPKKQKMLLSKSIVNAVRSQHPPGRFLQKNSRTDTWYDVGDQRATEKTSQALREGAPVIRNQMQEPAAASAASNGNKQELVETETATTIASTESVAAAAAVSAETEDLSPPMLPSSSSKSGNNSPPLMGVAYQPIATTSNPSAVGVGASNDELGGGGCGSESSMNSNNGVIAQPPTTIQVHNYGSSTSPPASVVTGGVGGGVPPTLSIPAPLPAQGPAPASASASRRSNSRSPRPSRSSTPTRQHPLQQQQQYIPGSAMMTHQRQQQQQQLEDLQQQLQQGLFPADGDDDVYSEEALRHLQGLAMSGEEKAMYQVNQQGTQPTNHVNGFHHHEQQDQHPERQHQYRPTSTQHGRAGGGVDYDDEPLEPYMPEPPTGLEHNELSFGSVVLTDVEHAKLLSGHSFGSVMSTTPAANNNNNNYSNNTKPQQTQYDQQQQRLQQIHQQHQQQLLQQQLRHFQSFDTVPSDNHATSPAPPGLAAVGTESSHHQEHPSNGNNDMPPPEDRAAVAPVDGGLEPQGLSIGSMMSIGTMKLEPAGLSIGSAMSFSVANGGPSAPDGGLENIGTSFGSLSLGTTERNDIVDALAAEMKSSSANPTMSGAVPTSLIYAKSKGSLLECEDTDDEDDSGHGSASKSADYEKLKATLAQMPTSTAPPRLGQSASASTPMAARMAALQQQQPIDLTRATTAKAMNHYQSSQHTKPAAAAAAPSVAAAVTGVDAFNIPTTTFDRDMSQMSALSDGGDFDGDGDESEHYQHNQYRQGQGYQHHQQHFQYQPQQQQRQQHQIMPLPLSNDIDPFSVVPLPAAGGCGEVGMMPPPPVMRKADSDEWPL